MKIIVSNEKELDAVDKVLYRLEKALSGQVSIYEELGFDSNDITPEEFITCYSIFNTLIEVDKNETSILEEFPELYEEYKEDILDK